jgi:hypothetical protein
MAADKLAAELAFKANVDAVSRDYVCEPHLGKGGHPEVICFAGKALAAVAEAMLLVLQSTGPFPVSVGPWWWLRASR